MKAIILTRGQIACVDDGDFDRINAFKWRCNINHYAMRSESRTASAGRTRKVILMHREINRTAQGIETDHIDGDRLNNSKSNLRSISRQNNALNKRRQTRNKLGVKGVHLDKGKYVAQIQLNKRKVMLGRFLHLESARRAYSEAARIMFGDYARKDQNA